MCGGSFAMGRSSDTIYLGIGDPLKAISTGGTVCIGGIVYVSRDGGSSWGSPIYLTVTVNGVVYPSKYITDVQVDRSQSLDIVLVSTLIGIFRSTDGGVSFHHVYPSSNIRSPPSYLVSSLVHTSAGWLGFDYYPANRQLIISKNGGQNWSIPVGSNWDTVTGSDSGVQLGRTTFAVANPGENVVYAVVGLIEVDENGNNIGPPGFATAQLDVFKSVDGGILWQALGCNSSYAPINPIPGTLSSSLYIFTMPLILI